jgi:hypothetical protein
MEKSAGTDESLIALNAARRRAALWQVPLVSDAEAAEMLNLPPSSWDKVRTYPNAPAGITLGRRLYFRTADLRTFIDRRAAEGAATP